ncbi:unnamed protein product (macronuclear) [Paramecium tetraurelia]|uniref:DBF4-type domain-containing protein n=1 Tax=Paramecium tetraurelia TaxID=5888 RepID=A0E3R4_PARTE|nr:uncharacterized protein GSPATT00023104001 [Paramecium tetraurelia]CAK89931.1 unnamed protein product [Paramecium tetraurelia]|eukprot:XP_001457328.1 hypothetical protein (macronuclear) [Paramecium tetraurelia strain d4-2]
MENNCKLCRQSTKQLILDKLQTKYFEAFNFYFAKPINEILSQITSTPHVIYYKDYLILDEQQEYMKRQYKQDEVKPRLDILTEFYVTNYKDVHPYLLIVDQHQLMAKRNKRIDKLYYQRVQQSQHSNKSNNQIVINNVLNSKLSSNSQISYETEEHDIYSSQDKPNKLTRLDFKGLNIINHQEETQQLNEMLDKHYLIINQMSNSLKKLPSHFYLKSPLPSQQLIPTNNIIKDLHTTKSVKRRTNHIDLREKKAILANSKSESKHSQSSFKMSKIKDSVDQQVEQFQEGVPGHNEPIDQEDKNKTQKFENNFVIQKMLRDYQGNHNRQLRQTISQDLIVASTSTVIQGFQGSQKSIKQDQNNNNNGSIQNISQRQEQLKKAYQPINIQQKKINQNQLDKITKGGSLTDRNSKQLPIAEDLFHRLHDLKIRSSQNADQQKKPEFNYMLPSQYNTLTTLKMNSNSKAKSQYSKKTTGVDLGTKSQHQKQANHSQSKVLNINSQKTDDIVKKYIQMATQSIQNHKKFDFKLNLQNLNNNEPHVEDDFCNYSKLFRKQTSEFSYRKTQLATVRQRLIYNSQKNCDQIMINNMINILNQQSYICIMLFIKELY